MTRWLWDYSKRELREEIAKLRIECDDLERDRDFHVDRADEAERRAALAEDALRKASGGQGGGR